MAVSYDDVLRRGRALAESRLRDTCRITRPGDGERTLDPDTGKYVDPEPVITYEGPCRIPRRSENSRQQQGGVQSFDVGEFPLEIPMAHPGYVGGESVRLDQTVTYLSSIDPELVGNVYGITGVSDQTDSTARRFRMKRTVG